MSHAATSPSTALSAATTAQPALSTSKVPDQTSCAKKRKLHITSEQEANKAIVADKEYLINEKNHLQQMMAKVTCGRWFGNVKVLFVQKYLDCQVGVECQECGSMEISEVNENPVTNVAVYSAVQNDIGYNGLHNFLGNLSMKPLGKTYFQYAKTVIEATIKKTVSVLEAGVSSVKKHYSENLKVKPNGNGIYDVRILFDGTWQKQGHTSLLAAGVVIDAETGLVIDYETISKICEACSKKAKNTTEEEFSEWFEEHRDQCKKNYTGSSRGMEAAAAVTLFRRSLAKKLRYRVFISEGDSSAYSAVCMMNDGEGPYVDVKVEKGECISHVAKRLGTALRKLRNQVETEKTTKKGKQLRMKRLEERGKLTDHVIKKLTQYYGSFIRRNVSGSVKQMRKDLYASFLHCLSTDANPQHALCPKTSNSWCFYQKAKANKQVPPSHKKMEVHFVLPSELRQKVWGEYRRLTSDKLLSSCILGKTQNLNENLHSRIWGFCSKYKNANKQMLDYALAQAISDYNVGYQEGYIGDLLGATQSSITKSHLQQRDRRRGIAQKKMKEVKGEATDQDYQSGAF